MLKTDPFSMVSRATKKAFQQVNRIAQVETDPDLQLYSTLKPQHFSRLMEVYGEGPIINYIREMESAKLMRKGGQ